MNTVMNDAMNTAIRRELHLVQRRIEALYDARHDDGDFENGLNFAVSGIEQAMGAIGGDTDEDAHPDDSLDAIENALAELHIRLGTRSEAMHDDAAQRARLARVDHLLAQACTLLADD